MKQTINILAMFFFIQYSFGQNEKIQKQINDIFFGYNITEKPKIIEYENRIPFDPDVKPVTENNEITFNAHPILSGDIKGKYNTTYLYDKIYDKELFEKYGIYQLRMTIEYKNYNECKKSFEKLKELFKNKNFRTVSEIGRENLPKSEKYIYSIDYLELPRVEIAYTRGPHKITINVYTSYDFNKYKKFKQKIF